VTDNPGFFWTILFFVLAIGPLIFVHELGHYLAGRWCGVKAEVFSIGFGKTIAGWTDRSGTHWKVGWLPLGGYVKFAGDMNAASTPNEAWKTLPEAERVQTFQARPLWQRAVIVGAGPVTNFLFAVLIFAGLLAAYGEVRISPVIGQVMPGSAAMEAGFLRGDRVLSINGRQVDRFADIQSYVALRPGQSLSFTIERSGSRMAIEAAPREDVLEDRFGNRSRRGLLGIAPVEAERVRLGASEIPGAAIRLTVDTVQSMADGLVEIVLGRRSLTELGGPIMIAKYSGQSAVLGFAAFLSFMALISINLGFINLLPIPMLDGGHLFFYAVEAVTRRPVPPEAQEWAFRGGFAALIGLMIFVTVNDLSSFEVVQRLTGLIG
jgi:regulator of sigma E protease